MELKVYENGEIALFYCSYARIWHIEISALNAKYNLSEIQNFSVFLTVLSEEPKFFFTNIFRIFKENGIDEKDVPALPFKKCISFCINNDLLYWLSLALKWLPFIDFDSELVDSLKGILHNSKYPQKLRHEIAIGLRKANY